LRDEVDLDRVIQRLEQVIKETLMPSQVKSWLHSGSFFQLYIPEQSAFTIGLGSELEDFQIALDDPILEYFLQAPGPFDLEQLDLDIESRHRLVSSGIFMVVPLITHGELVGWLGLGHRLSEQDYTSNDRILLARLAVQVAPSVRVAQLVAEQQAEAIERERLEQEMLVASRIQNALLPKALPKLKDYDMSAFYQPAREVGGDFYEFKQYKDGRLGIFIGDVTDKGIPAAMVMATTRTLLLAVANETLSPGEVLAEVNNLLVVDIPASMFVTCFYAILDPSNGRLVFSNAGHNLPYHHTSHEVLELKAAGMPLGLMPDMEYDVHNAVVGPGDYVILYSDGLVEAHNPQEEMFGYNRLIALIGEHEHDGPTLIDHLIDELKIHAGADWEQEDDITIVGVKRYNSSQNQDVG
jgi:serine phosphatase RsbU (regulator of sigma subunit)